MPPDSNPTKDRSYLVLEELDVVALLRTVIDDKELLDRVEDALPTGDHTVYRRRARRRRRATPWERDARPRTVSTGTATPSCPTGSCRCR